MSAVRKAVVVCLLGLLAVAAVAGASEAKAAPSADANTFQFQTEVNRMMKLIINSLYKNKEIFLRELISNASDALDKIRFQSLTDDSALVATPDLKIEIRADRASGLLHFTDTGVGMTRDDLMRNLGTIAKSGTSDFVNALEKSDLNMIGQFGVGFYSSFLVADLVSVTSKHNDDKQWIWESTGDSSFTITEDPNGDTLKRGTRITLYLKEDADSFLEESTLRELIQKYSEFINYPIYLWTTTVVEKDDEDAGDAEVFGAEDDEDTETELDGDDDDDDDDEPEVITEYVQVNKNRPLWTRSPSEITDEEYNAFFKGISSTTDDPIAHTHFSAEGEIDFKSLLFIPKRGPANLFTAENIPNVVKLFVRRVFITDELSDLLPRYLAFIRGLVDSDDLPLNVSRETLQQSKLLKVIKKKLTRKVLELIDDLSKDDERYEEFLEEYHQALKMGVMEDSGNRKRLTKLLRFKTSSSPKEWRSLEQYVADMKDNQEGIYFLTGTSVDEMSRSPFLERLLARGYEVVYMSDPIDEYVVRNLGEFEGKRFINIGKDKIQFEDDEADAAAEARMTKLSGFFKKTLADRIEKVTVSNRLVKSPVALVASQFGVTANMERIMRSSAYGNVNDPSTVHFLNQKKVLEVNPNHPIIIALAESLDKQEEEGGDQEEAKEMCEILYSTAALRSGYDLKNANEFADRVEVIVRRTLGVPLDAEAPEDEIKKVAREVEEEEIEGEEVNHDEL